jgi:hypothetical protein
MDYLAEYADNEIKEVALKRIKIRKTTSLLFFGIFVLGGYILEYDTKKIWGFAFYLALAGIWELLELMRDQKSLLQNIEIRQREIQIRLRNNTVDPNF